MGVQGMAIEEGFTPTHKSARTCAVKPRSYHSLSMCSSAAEGHAGRESQPEHVKCCWAGISMCCLLVGLG